MSLRDVLIDQNTGDLVVPIVWITGADAIAQLCRRRIKTFYGELFDDSTRGVKWTQRILGQKNPASVIDSELRQSILGCPGITGITSLSVSLDSGTRSGAVDFVATSDAGIITVTGLQVP